MLYAITLNYLRPDAEIQAQLEAHKAWLIHHIQTGNILFAGPLKDKAAGFVLAHATELAEIQQMIAADPFEIHGLVSFDIQTIEPKLRSGSFPVPWALSAKPVEVMATS